MSAELQSILASFQKCLDLRDKYMRCSLQRLGDNPRDQDGSLNRSVLGKGRDIYDVATLRADAPRSSWTDDLNADTEPPTLPSAAPAGSLPNSAVGETPWKIYPPPPPPHWRPGLGDHKPDEPRKNVSGDEEFDFASCDIPGVDEKGWEYAIDDKGVFQIYEKKVETSVEGSSTSLDLVDYRLH